MHIRWSCGIHLSTMRAVDGQAFLRIIEKATAYMHLTRPNARR